ncbi:MFS general substrate transporter [Polyplosphaeria fusca]|uniref:MFS general substrate transporter n=1 Tax=Polyplosphaeria fusca TaxID=682080 RepID=A0A9P4UXB7_9PLEO|nr:MFS general substrate transporter [Polyplosphaeria fusca]
MDSTTSASANANHGEMRLRQAVRQYSKYVGYILALMTTVLLWGYDAVIVGSVTALPAFQYDFGVLYDGEWIIPSLWLSLWMAFGPLGQALGAIATGWLQDRFGRRLMLLIGGIVMNISVAIIFFSNRAPNVDGKRGMFLAGKTLQGLASAVIKIEALTYISEITPTSLRGPSMALFPAFNLIGQLIGAVVMVVSESDESDRAYLIALGTQWILGLCPLVLAFVMPESPPYLVRKKDMDGALDSLTRLFAPKNDPQEMLLKIAHSIEAEERIAARVSYADCFRGSNRRRTLIIIFANLIPPFFGLPLLSSASYFLQQTGMESRNSLLFLVVGIVIGLFANAGSMWTLSHVRRRPLTIYTLLLAAVAWAAMGVSGFYSNAFIPWFTGIMCMFIIVICGLGCWPTSYAITSETSALRLRSKSQAIGGISAYVSAIVCNFVLPYLYNPDAANMKGKTGFVFTILCFVGAVWMWLAVPEMKGRSVDEIDHIFEQKVPARGSSKWTDQPEELRMAGV